MGDTGGGAVAAKVVEKVAAPNKKNIPENARTLNNFFDLTNLKIHIVELSMSISRLRGGLYLEVSTVETRKITNFPQ